MLAAGLALVVLNVGMIHGLQRWYPMVFPLAGLSFFVGPVQIVTGRAPQRLRDAPVGHWVLVFSAAAVGFAAGLAGNVLLTGEIM